ncbi:MAG: hypothetical protein V2I54_05640 [Bacteroidales bacterium]|jgi:hypothetical protein|nr:hypothetical protein [Bacteroidales bacterium]
MKTLKNFFRSENNQKTMNHFSDVLDHHALLMVKGGTEPDEDLWPPIDEDDLDEGDDESGSETQP